MTLKKIDTGAIVALLIAIICAAVWLGNLDGRVSSLEKIIQGPLRKINTLETKINSLENNIVSINTKLKKINSSESVNNNKTKTNVIGIKLDAGWKPEGSIANGGGGYHDGVLELKADIQNSDAYAELFLDLRAVRLPGIGQNADGSYNLVGREIIATVRSNKDFKGEPTHPNGVQFILKNENWESYEGTWLNITDAMKTSNGMTVFQKIANNPISRNVAGICLKFTIGTNSNAKYKGSFFIESVKIK